MIAAPLSPFVAGLPKDELHMQLEGSPETSPYAAAYQAEYGFRAGHSYYTSFNDQGARSPWAITS